MRSTNTFPDHPARANAQHAPHPRLFWSWVEAWSDMPQLRSLLQEFADVDARSVPIGDLQRDAASYRVFVPHLSHQVDKSFLDAAPNLELIGTPSTGSDHIDVASATARGITVVTLKDEREFLDTVQATAELAWLLILACARRLPEALHQVDQGGWVAQEIRGQELIGRTIGIVGYGRLGSMVSRFAQAFRLRVLATDPYVHIADPSVTQVDLSTLLAESDFVTLHVHLNEATRGMINRSTLACIKRGAILVNTSRGDVVDEAALIEALDDGRLAAVGLDVVAGERDPQRTQRPLFRYASDHPNVVITPHIGGCTQQSQEKAFLHFAQMLRRAWYERTNTSGGPRAIPG